MNSGASRTVQPLGSSVKATLTHVWHSPVTPLHGGVGRPYSRGGSEYRAGVEPRGPTRSCRASAF